MSLTRLAAGLLPRGASAGVQVTSSARPAAVLALFSSQADPELLFTERAATLRAHAGQMSFPGGVIDAGDADAVSAALREAREEVGLVSSEVRVLGELAPTRLSTAVFNVTTVVAGRTTPEPLVSTSPLEVASVHQYPVSLLADPQVRVSVDLPRGGRGPAFIVDEQHERLMIWGFTAHLVDQLLTLGGWQRAWHHDRVVPIPARFSRGRGGRA